MNFSTDRKFFFLKLFFNPVFLMRNIKSLFYKLCRFFINKLVIKLSSKHVGLKRKPLWLKNLNIFNYDSDYKNPTHFFLPIYLSVNVAELIGSEAIQRGIDDDPEDYLKENRWAFLLELILVNSCDINNNLSRVSDWINFNTDKSDVCWETYSACERVSNLLVFLSALNPSPMSRVFEMKAIYFVSDSLHWICQHIEYYGKDATNNHILNNARALVIGGVALGSESFCRVGMRIFREFLPDMVGENGFLRERSTHYQLIVTNWVLDAWHFIEFYYGKNHLDSMFLYKYFQRMSYASSFLCNMEGRLLGLVGDISPDLSPIQTAVRLYRLYPKYWPLKYVNCNATVIKDDWFRIDGTNQIVIGNFPKGTFPHEFPTHGHIDYTSFFWVNDGVEILVDNGRYRYTADAVSLLQKSAFGHSVLFVDEFSPMCESLIENGQWWPLPYASANLDSWVLDGTVNLSHDGFSRATNVLKHTRTISLNDAGLEVIDSLEGGGESMIRLRWNFGRSFVEFDNGLMIIKGSENVIQLSTKGFKAVPLVESFSGQLGGGWFSGTYGEVQPSISVEFSGSVDLPVVISTRFEIKKCAV